MNNFKPKLIIWDFDGVIADSEKIWLKNRQKILKEEYGINWDFKTTNFYIGGMSDKTKRQVLENLGIKLKTDFEQKALDLDLEIAPLEMKIIPDVQKILDDNSFVHCLATGGTYYKTKKKIEFIHFEKYFNNQNIFTADMVENGKPEPDLFLLAAQKMGYKPEECLVIEDSVPGMTAALKANIQIIAFLGSEMYKDKEYENKVKKLGIKNIFYKMNDLYKFITA